MTMIRGRRFGSDTKTLKPVRPNAAIEARFKRKLDAKIEEMHQSVMFWVESAYKNNEPKIAQDALPANVLNAAVAKLRKRWLQNFKDGSNELADHFAQEVSDRSQRALKKILKDAGFSVKFKMTPAMRDIFASTVNQNVSLINSIPAKYLDDVQQLVQQSVQAGRDMGTLTKALQEKYGVARRRAALISRDQNNKATSAFNRARQQELGIKKAVWMHSHAGREPRPSHVRMDGKSYDIAKGMWDSEAKLWIQPGELISCRCTSKPIVAGFE